MINSYLSVLNIFGWSNKPSEMLSDIHSGSNEFMLAIYTHNSIVFKATVFYPYLRKNSVTDTWEYDQHAFMRFILQHKNSHDKPWGENGYYSSTVSHVKFYFDYVNQSYSNFKNAMEYQNFYKFCLYYDFTSFAPSCIETFVRINNDITHIYDESM